MNQRFAGEAWPAELGRLLYQRTHGNPLFLVTVVDDAVRCGVLREGPAGGRSRVGSRQSPQACLKASASSLSSNWSG